jgi:hypothetical protein
VSRATGVAQLAVEPGARCVNGDGLCFLEGERTQETSIPLVTRGFLEEEWLRLGHVCAEDRVVDMSDGSVRELEQRDGCMHVGRLVSFLGNLAVSGDVYRGRKLGGHRVHALPVGECSSA